jgi:hypothetical protein
MFLPESVPQSSLASLLPAAVATPLQAFSAQYAIEWEISLAGFGRSFVHDGASSFGPRLGHCCLHAGQSSIANRQDDPEAKAK